MRCNARDDGESSATSFDRRGGDPGLLGRPVAFSAGPALARACSLLAAALLGLHMPAANALYKCFDSSGKVTYSDSPCPVQAPPTRRDNPKGARLTEKQVLAMLQVVDKAAMRMDVDGALSYMAEDVVIDLKMRTSRGAGHGTIGKRDYRRLWLESKDKIRNYRIRRDSVRVTINVEGTSADVSSNITETWDDPGGPMMLSASEDSIIELRAGKPRVRWIYYVFGEPKPQR
jgi:Domain of unknown function (DUF4124)